MIVVDTSVWIAAFRDKASREATILSALLDEVLELPASQRANWLDTLDGERAALKDTVRPSVKPCSM